MDEEQQPIEIKFPEIVRMDVESVLDGNAHLSIYMRNRSSPLNVVLGRGDTLSIEWSEPKGVAKRALYFLAKTLDRFERSEQ
jgi:hypothetical protein